MFTCAMIRSSSEFSFSLSFVKLYKTLYLYIFQNRTCQEVGYYFLRKMSEILSRWVGAPGPLIRIDYLRMRV